MKLLKVLVGIVIILLVIAIIKAKILNKTDNENSDKLTDTSNRIHCDYIRAEIKAYKVGTDELLDSKVVDGCFTISRGEMGLVEISCEQKNLKILYYQESDPKVLKYLDIVTGKGEPSRWRTKNGHDLFISDTKDALNFIFGDRKGSKIKGTIKLIK